MILPGCSPLATLAGYGTDADYLLVKVGAEGYIHGYICVRPPCGNKQPASLDKDTGEVTHPDAGHLGTVSKNPDGSYSAQYNYDGLGKDFPLGGRYASADDAAQAISASHNIITLGHQASDDPDTAHWLAMSSFVGSGAGDSRSAAGTLASAQASAKSPVLADHIADTLSALSGIQTAAPVPKPAPKPRAPKKSPDAPKFVDSLADIIRPTTRKDAISQLNAATAGLPSKRVDKIPWASKPFNVVGDDDEPEDATSSNALGISDNAIAIMSYMDIGTHDGLAAGLREGTAGASDIGIVKSLDRLIASNSLTADTTLYRGMSANDEMLSQLKVGTEFSDKSYVSTASSPSGAKYYSTLRSYSKDYKTGGIPIVMKITAPAGTHVAMGDPTVNEAILPRDTTFHVDSIDSRGVVNVSVVPK